MSDLQLTLDGREEPRPGPLAPSGAPGQGSIPERLFTAPQTIRGQMPMPAPEEEN